MNEMRLSDHVQDQINRYEAGRIATEKHWKTQYASATTRKQTAIRAALGQIGRSLLTFRLKKLIEGIQDLSDARQAPLPFRAKKLGRGPKELQYVSGHEGEERVRHKLQKLCRKPCAAVYGYTGASGEIDMILIGRYGITAIEVKNYTGMICSSGDSWWRIKSGQSEAIQDKSGRSPSLQLNQCADELQAVLSNNGLQIPIRRLVVLAHPNATYGNPFSPRVHYACKVEQLTRGVLFDSASANTLDRDQIARVCDVIQRAHAATAIRSGASNGDKSESMLYEDTYDNVAGWPWRPVRLLAVIFGAYLVLGLVGGYLMRHLIQQVRPAATSPSIMRGVSVGGSSPRSTSGEGTSIDAAADPAGPHKTMSGTEHTSTRKTRLHHSIQGLALAGAKHQTSITQNEPTPVAVQPIMALILFVCILLLGFPVFLRAIWQTSRTGVSPWTLANVMTAMGWTAKLTIKIMFLPFCLSTPRCWSCGRLGHIARNCPGRLWRTKSRIV